MIYFNHIATLIKTLLIGLFVLIFISCEKKIDLDLEESRTFHVVEAVVHDHLGDNYVILSRTRPFKNNQPVEMISNASVQIKDDIGNTYVLYESAPGYYSDTTLQGVANRTYYLIVNVEGKTITAESEMNPRVAIDSLSVEENLEAFWENPNVPEYSVLCHFTDQANSVNFYRVKAFLEGKQEKGFLAFNDEFIEGKSTRIPVFESIFYQGDSVTIQFLTIDEVNYRYFTALSSSQEGLVPGNPITNIQGKDVVGYFGAYAKSEKSIIVTE
ncbi:MAG: DUF4249 domain-containing protein [Vicingus serpentipes]|nr:DUF4249 domain-containing protein [Vicingus serpentipes]